MNYLAILAAGILSMVIGFAWYSPMLFGKEWMKLMGFTEKSMEKAKKKMGQMYTLSFVATIVMAYILNVFINATNSFGLTPGIQIGFWVWLGFIAPTMLTGVLFGKQPMQLYLINVGYQLATLLVMGGVLGLWG